MRLCSLAPVVFTFEKLFGNETVMFHEQTVFQGQLVELSLKN